MKELARSIFMALALVAPLLTCSEAGAQSAGFTIAPDAQLLNSNAVLISGTVPCTYAGQRFYISIHVSQGHTDEATLNGGQCTTANGPQPFTIAIPSFGTFHKGKAYVTARAGTCENDDCHFYSAEAEVQIRD